MSALAPVLVGMYWLHSPNCSIAELLNVAIAWFALMRLCVKLHCIFWPRYALLLPCLLIYIQTSARACFITQLRIFSRFTATSIARLLLLPLCKPAVVSFWRPSVLTVKFYIFACMILLPVAYARRTLPSLQHSAFHISSEMNADLHASSLHMTVGAPSDE